jgi:hypothetical protein
MQNISINSQKITRENRHKNKDKKSGFDIIASFKEKLWIKQACRQKANKHTKILSNSIDSFAQVAPLDSTFHKDSNKI